MGVKAIIFDCDGTLVDSERTHYRAWKLALQKQGYLLTFDEYKLFIGKSTEAFAEMFSRKIGKDCAEEIVEDKVMQYRNLQREGIPPIKPTIDFVRQLSNEKESLGLKLGVASALRKDEIVANLRHAEIEDCFEIVLSGLDDLISYDDSQGVNKPKPYIYLHAAKLLNLQPHECVVIEDSSTGVEAGAAAGCFTVAVPNQYTLSQDFSRAQLTVESFANIDVGGFLQMVGKKNV